MANLWKWKQLSPSGSSCRCEVTGDRTLGELPTFLLIQDKSAENRRSKEETVRRQEKMRDGNKNSLRNLIHYGNCWSLAVPVHGDYCRTVGRPNCRPR